MISTALIPAPAPHEGQVVAGQCPVCGGALASGHVVTCARCDTAHHQDCIEYGGACAIFACGSRAYRTARRRLAFIARPPPDTAVMIKKDGPAETRVCTMPRPVIRIASRRTDRTRRVAAALGIAGLVLLGALISTGVPGALPGLKLLFAAIRELAGIQPLIILVLGLTVLGAGWLTAVAALPAAAYGLGFMIHRADESDCVLDSENRRLIEHASVWGVSLGMRSWDARSILSVALTSGASGISGTSGTPDSSGSSDTSGPVRLEARLVGGSTLVLADDNDLYLSGYHWTDLSRIGRRLASALEVPFLWSLPWKADPEGEIPAK